jgi:AcrR family transcriptional regulator
MTAATTRKRGAYRKSRATQQAILDAGLEVFGRSGYHKGSLREIADKVAMSEAGMLHHFPSKSALLAAVLDRRDQETRAMVDFSSTDPRDFLRSFVDVARHSAARPGVVELYCMLSAEATATDHPAHAYFQARYALGLAEMRGFMERLRDSGDLVPGLDPERAARFMLAVWDGLQVQWLLDRESCDVAEELEAFFDRLLITPLTAEKASDVR